ncbi:phosphatase PAP2 family protein [Geodermatophilaceae bacterium NBWT11]|nr:phosphatase PAP2 family protein [Geodermatophilaceae bacterium NBWT11]
MTAVLTRRRAHLLVAVACALAWLACWAMVATGEGVAEDDGTVLRWLVGHRDPTATRVLGGISSTPVDLLLVLGAAAVVAVVASRARSWWPLVVLGTATTAAVVLAETVKAVVGRARPAATAMLGRPETGSGFPSAHTLVLGAVLGAAALSVWRWTTTQLARVAATTTAVGLSAAMGLSRLYLGDHWLTDVLASYALVGVVLAGAACLPHPRRDLGAAATRPRDPEPPFSDRRVQRYNLVRTPSVVVLGQSVAIAGLMPMLRGRRCSARRRP